MDRPISLEGVGRASGHRCTGVGVRRRTDTAGNGGRQRTEFIVLGVTSVQSVRLPWS